MGLPGWVGGGSSIGPVGCLDDGMRRFWEAEFESKNNLNEMTMKDFFSFLEVAQEAAMSHTQSRMKRWAIWDRRSRLK